MSLDLALLPIDSEDNRFGFAHSVLQVNQGRLWNDLLKDVRLHDVPDDFHTYLCKRNDVLDGESHYGDTQATPYGEPLRAARVEDILRVIDQFGTAFDWNRRDAAAIAYLRMLDPRMKIALYWH